MRSRNPIPSAPAPPGGVLPAGLSQLEFEAFITQATYTAALGSPITSFELSYLEPDNDADLSGDGDVDDEDLGLAFGAFTGPLAPINVPEPASALLLALGGLVATRRWNQIASSGVCAKKNPYE